MQLVKIFAFAFFLGMASCTEHGDVRIIKKGEVSSEGNVEIFWDNDWMGICADDINTWDIDAVSVVCSQLNYPYATTPSITGYYSRSNVTYSIHDVICRGDEDVLLECSFLNYSIPEVECNNPASAACVTAEEVLVYAVCFFLSCMFCCCSTFVIILMCFMIASCPLAILATSSRRPADGVVIDDPTRPLMIDPNTNYKTKPPAYTN
ncbi:Lysyl oxidase-like protein 2B [Oopsacas minuta]|uniref:Lysyl oxidase-like protein 2B n=1 Tax=Oopsacas minuta TaxID=111878 RepID=A0AAV7K1C6_9METZ|nr:Lysyl oxidase-like protein 2B [Oopsacas minuta]